ncbi:hypothetical protein D3C81_2141730 [compost metagenome]
MVRFELESGQPLIWKRDLHKAGEVVCQLGKADLGIQRDGTANGHPGRCCMGKQFGRF